MAPDEEEDEDELPFPLLELEELPWLRVLVLAPPELELVPPCVAVAETSWGVTLQAVVASGATNATTRARTKIRMDAPLLRE